MNRPAAGGAERPGAYAWYALGLLTAINAVNYIDRNVIFVLFEPIKQELGLTDTQLGWLGSAYIILFSAGAVPLGILADLRSRRNVIAAGVAVWSAFTALSGLARQYWQLLVCRSMVGIGEAAYSPAAQSLLADYFPSQGRALAFGVFWGGLAVGGVGGIWLGGELEHLYGWRTAFMAVSVPGLLLAMLTTQLRDPTRDERRLSVLDMIRRLELTVWHLVQGTWPLWAMGAAGLGLALVLDRLGYVTAEDEGAIVGTALGLGAAATVARMVRRLLASRGEHRRRPMALTTLDEIIEAGRLVLRTPTLIWVFSGGALISFAMNGLVGWSPSYLQRELGLEPQMAGRLMGVWGLIAGSLGVVFGGRVADWLKERHSTGRVVASAAGFLLGAPMCVLLLTVRDLDAFIPLFFVTIFLFTWYNGPVTAVIFDVVPSSIGASVVGAYVFFSHLAGDAVAYPLIGFLSDRFGIRTAMYLLPLVAVAGAGVLLVGTRTVAGDMQRLAEISPGPPPGPPRRTPVES
ncbi:MAG TPA: MFS transporter [Gemmatimonadales bacterium]|nr:MFS transporter [Gemmatimonadales bacterium]